MGVETTLRASRLTATPAMTDDNHLIFSLPSVLRKKVTAAFDGGRLSSDSGVMLLALAERRRKVAATLAALIADRRDASHITHTVADVLRARMLAIGCGYADGKDFDWLRCDAAFKLAYGRLPDTGTTQLIGVRCDDREGVHPLAGGRVAPVFPQTSDPKRAPVLHSEAYGCLAFWP